MRRSPPRPAARRPSSTPCSAARKAWPRRSTWRASSGSGAAWRPCPRARTPLEHLSALGPAYREAALAEPGYYASCSSGPSPASCRASGPHARPGRAQHPRPGDRRLHLGRYIVPTQPRKIADALWAAAQGAISLERAGHLRDGSTTSVTDAAVARLPPCGPARLTRRHRHTSAIHSSARTAGIVQVAAEQLGAPAHPVAQGVPVHARAAAPRRPSGRCWPGRRAATRPGRRASRTRGAGPAARRRTPRRRRDRAGTAAPARRARRSA